MSNNYKVKTGIWLDSRTAILISFQGKQEQKIKIKSDVDESRPKGGSGSSVPYGAQDSISEKAFLERRKHQFQKFYSKIVEEINNSDEIVIIGPAEAKLGLQNYIEQHPWINPKILSVQNFDSLSENQIKAHMKSIFDSSE